MSGYQNLVAESVKLISLPDIYLRARVVLNDPESSAQDVGDVLRVDPGLSTRLLRLANSSFYGFRARVETISRAVALLGRQQIHDVVLATTVARAFSGVELEVMDVTRFWRDSIHTALGARILAKLCNVLDAERLFVHGLLADLGHLVMYQHVAGPAQEARIAAAAQSRLLAHVEQEMIGFDYTQVGGELLRIWDMPAALQHSVRWQMQPDAAGEHVHDAAIVHMAALLTTVMDSNESADFLTLPFSPEALRLTGVSEETLCMVRLEARSYLDEACGFLLPEGALDATATR